MKPVILAFMFLQASTVVRTEEGPNSLRVIVSWPERVQFTTRTEKRELFVRFDRALAPPVEDLARKFPGWIEGISFSYDSFLLRTVQDATFTITGKDNDVVIQITPAAERVFFSPPSEAVARLRLELLKAQLLMNTEQEKDALDLLTDLTRTHPDEPQVVLNMADAEMRRGRWLRAKRLYDRVLHLDSEHDEAPKARRLALHDQVSRVRMDIDRRTVRGAQAETRLQWSGHHLLKDSLRLGLSADWNRFRIPNGVTGERRRAEVYLQHDTESGRSIRAGLLTAASSWGATGEFRQTGASGSSYARVDYRRPFWEFVESLMGGGTRDRMEAGRQQTISSRLAARFTGAANRYGLAGQPDAARSLGFESTVTYVARRNPPSLGFEYGFHGEYRATSRPHSALPLVSREVHSAGIFGGTGIHETLQFDVAAGYTIDRLGGKGPFASGRLTYRLLRHGEAQVWFERRLNSVVTGQVVHRYGALFTWRFE